MPYTILPRSARFADDSVVPMTDMITDRALIDAHLDGNEAAFAELYERYRLPLYSYLNRMAAGRTALADDLYQQTWIRVIDSLPRYSHQQKFISWLLRIAHNLAVDHFRRERRAEHVELGEHIPCAGDAPDAEHNRRQMEEALVTAIDTLSPEQREVLELRRQGLSFKEIAEIERVSINTVLGRMHYAVKKLQKLLAEWL